MSLNELYAKHDRIDKITEEEQKGIDEYIENVNDAIKTIEYVINTLPASGNLLDEIKNKLLEDIENLKYDIKKLSNLSNELKIKIEGYKRYLSILSKAIK